MKNRLIALVNKFATPAFRKIIGYFSLISLVIYLFINISAYAQWFPNSTSYFVFSSKTGILFRFFSSGLVLLASLFVFISYYDEIDKKWLIVFLFIAFFSIFSIIYTNNEFTTYYKTTRLYDFMAEYYVSVSLKEIFLMQGSFLLDILFGFCFMFLLSKSIKREYVLLIVNLFLLIILYSEINSLVKERNYYIKFLSGDWSYTNTTVGSIFGNKQQWGIFLISAFPASFLSIYLSYKSQSIKPYIKAILIIFNVLTLILTFLCGVMSFCKTAIVSFALFLLIFFIGLIIVLFKRKRTRIFGFAFIVFAFLALIALVCMCIFSPKIQIVISNILETLESRSSESVKIRFVLIYGLFQNYPLTNLFFGIPKGLVDPYVRSLMPEVVNGLHTGIAILFARIGVIGLFVFLLLNIKLFKKYISLNKKTPILALILICTFSSSLILNLSEADILIFSSSMVGFILNICLVLFPMIKNEQEESDEKIYIFSC